MSKSGGNLSILQCVVRPARKKSLPRGRWTNSWEPSLQKQRSYILPFFLKHMLETLQHPEVAGRFRELNDPSPGVEGSGS